MTVRLEVETAVAALKVQRTAYQEQMKKVRDASDAGTRGPAPGLRAHGRGARQGDAQAFGQFAT